MDVLSLLSIPFFYTHTGPLGSSCGAVCRYATSQCIHDVLLPQKLTSVWFPQIHRYFERAELHTFSKIDGAYIHNSIDPYIDPLTHPSIYIHPSIHGSIHPLIHVFTHLFLAGCMWLSNFRWALSYAVVVGGWHYNLRYFPGCRRGGGGKKRVISRILLSPRATSIIGMVVLLILLLLAKDHNC